MENLIGALLEARKVLYLAWMENFPGLETPVDQEIFIIWKRYCKQIYEIEGLIQDYQAELQKD